MALKVDGTVWEWPGPWIGPVPAPSGFRRMPYQISNIDDVVAIAAGETRSLAVKRDSTVWEWTSESPAYGNAGVAAISPHQVIGLDAVVAVSVAYEAWMGTLVDSRTVALKRDGTVWAWYVGERPTRPVRVGELDRIVAISAASAGDVALRDDGTVWEWDDRLVPVQVSGLDDVVAVANGTSGSGWAPAKDGGFGLALKRDGTVWGWASPSRSAAEPALLQGLAEVAKIAAAGVYVYTSGEVAVMLAIKRDGTVWAWGQTWNGQLSDGAACGEPITIVP